MATTFGSADDSAEYDAMIAATEQAGRLLPRGRCRNV